jgi:hypothetical protein
LGAADAANETEAMYAVNMTNPRIANVSNALLINSSPLIRLV